MENYLPLARISLASSLERITSGRGFSGLSRNYGRKGSKGMAMERPPKQIWVQPYLPGLDPDQPVELSEPEKPDANDLRR